MDAYRKKQAGQFLEALKVYTSVLEDEFLRDAKIDKHVFMRYNAHKNSGEAYEKTRNFPLAKYHYTQALKIQQKDSFIWTRLGFLEFEHFKDLKMAQACFEAAAKTLNTLEKRGTKMCPILVKLAEINFLLYDFKASEVMVNTLIQRALPEQTSLVFAYLMKAYFARLKNEPVMAQECLKRAQKLRADASVDELSVIKVMQEQRASCQKEPFMISPTTGEYVHLGEDSASLKNVLTMKMGDSEDLPTFPQLFAHFTKSFRKGLEDAVDNQNKISLVLDCQDHLDCLKREKVSMRQNWAESFAQSDHLMASHDEKVDDVPMEQVPTTKDAKDGKTAQVGDKRSGLRRKLDNEDIQMRKIKLEAFDEFKEKVLFRDDFQEITSQSQIKAIQSLFLRRANMSELPAESAKPEDVPMEESKSLGASEKTRVVPSDSLLNSFEHVLSHIQGKNVYYVARNLLRFAIDGEARQMLTASLAFDIFRIYTLVVQASGLCSKSLSGLDQLDQFSSFNVLLVVFELALFNNDVIKRAKSGPVMSHRQQIFSYLSQFVDSKNDSKRETYADYRLREQISHLHKGDSVAQQEVFQEFKVRLLYAMMFYSFEIQNDMPLSVTIYQMLDLDQLQSMKPIQQPWISHGAVLDLQKISTFGNCKIQEAQKVRDYDHALNNLKQADVKQMKKGGKAQPGPETKQYQPECIDYARFYLEQLFNYLVLALGSENQSSELSSLSVSFSSNEEKINEMWDKLCYSLSKAETSEMLPLVQYVFCTLTAFQILHKPYYDSFILKRLDFGKIISSVSERLHSLLDEVWLIRQTKNEGQGQKIRDRLEQIMKRSDAEMLLLKLEMHMVRLFTPEWLHLNVRQHGELDNQLLQAYYKSLFSIETLKSCLKGGNYKCFEGALLLLKNTDQVAEENSEMMLRPYLRLVQHAFPYLVQLFSQETRISKRSLTQLKSLLQSNLAAFIETSLTFLLHFEVKFDDMLPQVHVQDSRQGAKTKSFAVIIKIAQQPSSGGLHFFKEIAQINKAKLNVPLMSDVISCLDFCLEGRLLNHSQLTVNDLSQVVKITEAMGCLVFQYRNSLQERCPLSKERCIAIKNTYRDTNQLLAASMFTQFDCNDACLCVKQGKSDTSCYEQGFPVALSSIIFFLLNVFSQVGLPSASAILPSIQLGQRSQFLERLSSLNELKKLRALSYIDLQYSQNLEVSSLMMSYTFLQYYQTSNEAKIQTKYQEANEYKDMRQFHKQAANCVVAAINFSLRNQNNASRDVWGNVSETKLMQLAIEQLLQIQLVRIRGKEHVKQFQQPLSMPTVETYLTPFVYLPSTEKGVEAIKLRLLRDEASLYASMCAKLDRLSSPALGHSNDPRSRGISQEKLLGVSKQMIQIFLKHVAETQVQLNEQQNKEKPVPQMKNKQMLLSDKGVQACKSSIEYIFSEAELQAALKTLPASTLTYDYTYLEAILLQEDELQVNSCSIELLLKSLNIAIASNNSGGVFQAMIKIIEVGLLMAIQLKYNQGSPGMPEETKSRYQQTLETIRQDVLYDAKLKSMLDQFYALTMQGVQDKVNMAEKQGAMFEFQFDQELLIYDRHAVNSIRQRLLKKQSFNEINQTEKLITKLYETGDKLVLMLTKQCQRTQASAQQAINTASETKMKGQRYQDLQKEQLKVEFNQMLARNFFYEFQAHISKTNNEYVRQQKGRPPISHWEEGWNMVHEMQAQVNKDLANISELLQINIQTFQQLWNSDVMLCPLGTLKPNAVTQSSKHLLNLQVVQSSLTQFFSVDCETRVMQDGSISRVNRAAKSIARFYNCNIFTAGMLRAKVKQLLLQICEMSGDYEPARDIFKSTMTKVKQNMNQQNICRYREMQTVFDLSKQIYFSLITRHAENLCSRYSLILKEINFATSKDKEIRMRNTYYELRQKYHTSNEYIPPILRDIFEVFVETHNSKQFLRKLELLTGEQQLQLRKSVLKVCAVCGPDSEMGASGLITTKFINLAKLNDHDYLYEGLRICISWFEKVLEGTATSHNLGTNQAITGKLTARGSKSAFDLRKRLLETYEEIEKNISKQSKEADKAPITQQKISKETTQAQQAFKATKQIAVSAQMMPKKK